MRNTLLVLNSESLGYFFCAVTNKDDKPYVEVIVDSDSRKVFSPEEVSAMILTKMKETAEVSNDDSFPTIPYLRDCGT